MYFENTVKKNTVKTISYACGPLATETTDSCSLEWNQRSNRFLLVPFDTVGQQSIRRRSRIRGRLNR